MYRRFSSVIAHSIDDVFGWHERPGAIVRMMPGWQPVRVVRPTESLRDGTAVIALPGGVTWHAEHGGYDPPHRFVDTLRTSLPVKWRHVHEFTEQGPDSTRVTDRLDTNIPALPLAAMFRYRHRQLASDLAAIKRSRAWSRRRLTVAVTGSSGMVGTALTAFLDTAGHDVIRLVRRHDGRPDSRYWDPTSPDPYLLSGVDVVIHLAGAPIMGRFTQTHKRAVRDSRIEPTHRLAQLAAATPDGPEAFVCASAIGYYGPDRGETELVEQSAVGQGFLAEVVADWEAATEVAAEAGLRVVKVRTGLVQSPAGGMLKLMHRLFSTGLGGRLGDGRQWMSWIDIDDLVDIYHRAILDEELTGPVNAVAPHPVRNSTYTKTLAQTLNRPAVIPVPWAAPTALLGAEGVKEFAAADQYVLPGRLTSRSHHFRHRSLESSFRHLFGKPDPAASRTP